MLACRVVSGDNVVFVFGSQAGGQYDTDHPTHSLCRTPHPLGLGIRRGRVAQAFFQLPAAHQSLDLLSRPLRAPRGKLFVCSDRSLACWLLHTGHFAPPATVQRSTRHYIVMRRESSQHAVTRLRSGEQFPVGIETNFLSREQELCLFGFGEAHPLFSQPYDHLLSLFRHFIVGEFDFAPASNRGVATVSGTHENRRRG